MEETFTDILVNDIPLEYYGSIANCGSNQQLIGCSYYDATDSDNWSGTGVYEQYCYAYNENWSNNTVKAQAICIDVRDM